MAQGYDRSFELLERETAARAQLGARRGDRARSGRASRAHRARRFCRPRRDRQGLRRRPRPRRDARTSGRELPGALVDLGGDIAVAGAPPENGPWLIAVESAWSPAKSLGTVRLTSGGIATSGPARRRFGPAGAHHHIIDPATGESAERGPLTVTVIAQDPSEADAHATALAISDDADEYMRTRPALGALVVGGLEPPRVLGVVDFMPRPVSFEVTL